MTVLAKTSSSLTDRFLLLFFLFSGLSTYHLFLPLFLFLLFIRLLLILLFLLHVYFPFIPLLLQLPLLLLNSIVHEIRLVHFESGQYCTCVFYGLYRNKSLLLDSTYRMQSSGGFTFSAFSSHDWNLHEHHSAELWPGRCNRIHPTLVLSHILPS
jgi:hypothetical protein